MGMYQTFLCIECKKEKREFCGGGEYPSICSKCYNIKEKEKRIAHFLILDNLSIEQRIRKIEEWIYDYKPPVSLRDMRF